MLSEYEAARLRHPSSGAVAPTRRTVTPYRALVAALEDLSQAMSVQGPQSREAALARAAVMSASDVIAESWQQEAA
jgi:hypothetical protein